MPQAVPLRSPAPCCSDGACSSAAQPPVRNAVFVGLPTCSVARPTSRRGGGWAVFRDSFRPFYLGAAVFAAFAVTAWLGTWYHGFFPPSIPGLLWHMHEMVFGFAAAVIVGFLFTAARNWTGLPLPAGTPLAAIFLLWLAGRVGMFVAYGPATAIIDSSLLLIVAAVLAHKFIRARSLCSMPLVAVVSTLGLANIAFHASMHNLIAVPPVVAVEFGLMLVVLVEMIVGGRVVPGFTANAIPGVRQYRAAWLHRAAFALAALAFVFDAFRLPAPATGMAAVLAALAVAAQAIGWNPLSTRKRPILWILHLSYAWIPVGLLLLGLASFSVVTRSAAIHALAVGSMSGLIMGMITRTALGHSGRQVRAGRSETTAYVLVHVAAASRVAAALIPAFYIVGMSAAGIAWLVAFSIYAIAYAPVLLRSRPSPEPALV